MDKLIETLQELQLIRADGGFTRKSREALLRSAHPKTNPWSVFLQALEVGAGVALVAVLLLLISGGFSSGFLTPLKLSSLDPAALRAEAEAIDIQIQLADLNYLEPKTSESTPPALLPAVRTDRGGEARGPEEAETLETQAKSVNIDEALRELSL
ncbi:hypothetical protein C4587_00615 [Candidatus Parcubacteria bacterium]|nr:MAG: hypothetical protein C4587_00615 [Candidatus Parcubacteria bacterium]